MLQLTSTDTAARAGTPLTSQSDAKAAKADTQFGKLFSIGRDSVEVANKVPETARDVHDLLRLNKDAEKLTGKIVTGAVDALLADAAMAIAPPPVISASDTVRRTIGGSNTNALTILRDQATHKSVISPKGEAPDASKAGP